MSLDFNSLSLKELKDIQAQVQKAIASYEDRVKKKALAELEEKARELGFSLAELAGISAPRKKAPAVAKYANPENTSETWSGRGRRPRWFEAALEAGLSVEDLEL